MVSKARRQWGIVAIVGGEVVLLARVMSAGLSEVV